MQLQGCDQHKKISTGERFVISMPATASTRLRCNMLNSIDESCWDWRHKGEVSKRYEAQGDVNILIDHEPNNLKLVTSAVNGGDNGLRERREIFDAIRDEWELK